MEPAVQEQPLTFPKRPQPSSKFLANPIQLKSNHFTISIANKNVSICLYDMKIIDFATEGEIPADARDLREAILRSANRQLKTFFGENYWTSGRDLWSMKDQRDPKTIPTKEKGRDYGIFLTKVTETRLRPEAFEDSEKAAKTTQFLNVIFKRFFKEKGYKEWNFNSKFYDWNHRENMNKYPLAICKGFKTSAEVYQNFVPKVLVDRISRIVHTTSVLDLIKHLKTKKSDQEIREILRGRSVIASYGNYRMWRIDDIDFGSNEESKFETQNALKGKQKISYREYYKAHYNIEIKSLQPALLIHISRKTGAKIVLLPELVHMTGLDEDMRADFGLMEQVAKSTRLNPNERMNQIKSEVQNLATFLENNYGISMSKESLVDGLVLPTPELRLGSRSFTPQEGSFTVREPIFKPKPIENWLLVYPADYENDAQKLLETLKKCSKEFAIQVLDPIKIKIQGKSQSAMKEAVSNKVQANTSIVVCVFPPPAKKHWYKALKDVCYREKGVPSQAVLTTSFKEHPMSVGSKILLQMSAKIGAELWISQNPEGLPEKTMIIGADVYHKTKVGEELLSCIGFCASTNPHFSQFFSKVHFQKRVGDEIMINIGKLVKEAVLYYFKLNKFFPECIIFFRDGLADNQLQHALEIETQGILQQLKTINPDYNTKFAEIVVTKRIEDRIFTMEETLRSSARGKGSRSNRRDLGEEILFNPPPGTVVADTIVSNNFDYLVMSPYVEQGTCTPTRYFVIYDTTGLPQEVFWQLTYWQCYNYFNWSGSVRVPAPVQYAHKLAYLVGQTVQGEVDKKLVTSLYYL